MPEGPELAIAADFINRVCAGKIFSKITKSEVSRHAPVEFNGDFFIFAKARGKELMVKLTSTDPSQNPPKFILFHFGMSGRFAFGDVNSAPKHAHLSFWTSDLSQMLHFIDVRRFGKWVEKPDENGWSADRGPSALNEYELFRKNITQSLDDSVFDRSVCEAMLDQRYFNGIGNYLRAEIIYRADVNPFAKARTVLESLGGDPDQEDILSLCRKVQEEVVALQSTFYTGTDSYVTDNDKSFDKWLQCYANASMKKFKDSNGRTFWFAEKFQAPKRKTSTGRTVKRKHTVTEVTTSETPADAKPKKPRKTKKVTVKEEAIETTVKTENSDDVATVLDKKPVIGRSDPPIHSKSTRKPSDMASYYDDHNCQPMREGEQPDHDLHLARLLLDTGVATDMNMDFERLFPRGTTVPASKAFLESLKETATGDANPSQQCPVCLGPYEKGDTLLKLPCKHCFHDKCIFPWLEKTNTCPLCRQEMPTDDADYEKFRHQKERAKQREAELETLHGSMYS